MGGKSFGAAMLICATVIWGTSLVAQSIGMQHMGPFTFNAIRFLIGGISVFLFIRFLTPIRKKSGSTIVNSTLIQHSGRLLYGGVACGVTLFATASFQQIGICYTTVGKAGFITALYIVIVPMLGILLGKKVSLSVILCVAMAMAGMYLLCINERFTLSKGDIYVSLCAVTTAVHILLIGYFSPITDGVKLSCLQFFVCGTLSSVCAFIVEFIDLSTLIGGWVPILYTGVLSCAIAYTFQTLGQREIGPVVTSIIFSLEAVFAALSGWFVLGEGLSTKEICGCILIFVAIIMAQLPRLWLKTFRRKTQ